MKRDIDVVIEQVRQRLPAIVVRQHHVTHASDDDGIWWFSLPGLTRDVHVESSSANCPFVIETNEQSSGDALKASSVDEVARLVVQYLGAASRNTGPVYLMAERYWR